jgi:hypothetical protein
MQIQAAAGLQRRHWIPATNFTFPSRVSFSMNPLCAVALSLATATAVCTFNGQLAPHGDQTRDVKPTLETAVYGSNSGPWNMVDVLAWFWFAEAQAD